MLIVFKVLGVALVAPLIGLWLRHAHPRLGDIATSVVLFHLAYNVVISLGFIGMTQWVASLMARLMPAGRPGQQEPAAPAPPRPLGAGHAVARHFLRGARGIAPGRPGGSHAGGDVHRDPHGRPQALGRIASN